MTENLLSALHERMTCTMGKWSIDTYGGRGWGGDLLSTTEFTNLVSLTVNWPVLNYTYSKCTLKKKSRTIYFEHYGILNVDTLVKYVGVFFKLQSHF